MIGYRITQAELEQRIRTEKAGWLARAARRTARFRHKGRYEEKQEIWSEIKVVYMRLQGNAKCAYCERKLEAENFGKVEQDVEHFRPKGNVKSWEMPRHLVALGIKATAVPHEKRGYFLLSYHLFNYAAAWKPCNSILKRDYCPIAGVYDLSGEDPMQLQNEQPYLIYPIGDYDTDPEQLIRFHGVLPQAVAADGYRRHRALVTIEFFKLDDINCRKHLILERARILIALFPQLKNLHQDVSVEDKTKARQIVERFTQPTAPHTNCARSFRDLFDRDPDSAKAIFDKAVQFITTTS